MIVFGSVCEIYSQEFKAKITYRATLDNEDFYNRLIKDTTITEVSKNAKLIDITSTSPTNFHLIINGNEALYQAEYDIETRIRLGFKPNRTNVVAQHFYIYYTNKQTNEKFFHEGSVGGFG